VMTGEEPPGSVIDVDLPWYHMGRFCCVHKGLTLGCQKLPGTVRCTHRPQTFWDIQRWNLFPMLPCMYDHYKACFWLLLH
jgi:hypothetical protein